MRLILTKTFSDMDYFGFDDAGKALREFKTFCNNHPYIKILHIFERQQVIKNAGNGTKYYDIDLIFSIDSKYCEKNCLEEWQVKEELL